MSSTHPTNTKLKLTGSGNEPFNAKIELVMSRSIYKIEAININLDHNIGARITRQRALPEKHAPKSLPAYKGMNVNP